MGTTRSFSAMLNDYLPNELLKEELVKRNYIISKVEQDNDWMGGNLIVPFRGSQASSTSFGSLTSSTDVAEDVYVRGSITTQPEVWGTMIFNQRDLMEHNKLSEQNFLKILPDTIDDFMDFMKQTISLSITNGAYFATATVDGTNAGNITVDRPERFVIKQKVVFKGTSNTTTGYVQTINMNTGVIHVETTRAGGANSDLSLNTVADATKAYFDGSQTNPLTALKSSLLPLSAGGSTNLYGQAKTAYPYLQAIAASGAAITATNILDKIFDHFTLTKNRGKGNPNSVLVSYKHLGSIMKVLEAQKGAYHIEPGSTKVNAYGWTEIMISGVQGGLTVVGIQEMDDDWIPFIDWRALKLYSNGSFRKNKSPDGDEYFVVRNTTGYQYIVDICFFGDLVLLRPSYCGVLYSISY